jgi:MFS family permease
MMSQSYAVGSSAEPVTHSKRKRAIRANLIGTVLEWYDFYIYGTATALAFGPLFFPSVDPVTGAFSAFATYAIGFVIRPIAGIYLARWGDTIGRKKVMVICLMLMGIATGLIGVLPTYSQVGMLAPVLLLALRLVQSIGAGAEYGTAVTMSSEFSRPGRRAFAASTPALGVSLGVLLGTGVFAILGSLPRDVFLSWGWRVPFLIGFALVFVGLYIRLRVDESPEFVQLQSGAAVVRAPLRELLRSHRRNVTLASLARASDAVGSQIFNVFTISYTTTQLGMDPGPALTGVMVANLAGLLVIPAAGRLADRFGFKPVFLVGLTVLTVGAFPFFWLLDTRDPVLVVLALLVMYGGGVKIVLSVSGVYLSSMFEARVRNTGVNFARSLSDPLAGFTPLIATSLLVLSGGASWTLGGFVAVVAVVSGIAVFHSRGAAAEQSGAPSA